MVDAEGLRAGHPFQHQPVDGFDDDDAGAGGHVGQAELKKPPHRSAGPGEGHVPQSDARQDDEYDPGPRDIADQNALQPHVEHDDEVAVPPEFDHDLHQLEGGERRGLALSPEPREGNGVQGVQRQDRGGQLDVGSQGSGDGDQGRDPGGEQDDDHGDPGRREQHGEIPGAQRIPLAVLLEHVVPEKGRIHAVEEDDVGQRDEGIYKPVVAEFLHGHDMGIHRYQQVGHGPAQYVAETVDRRMGGESFEALEHGSWSGGGQGSRSPGGADPSR